MAHPRSTRHSTSSRLSMLVAFTLLSSAGFSQERSGPNEREAGYALAEDVGVVDEALPRKERSIARLKKERVPVLEHLPLIATEAESKRRTTDEVAKRAIALCVVSAKGEGLSQDMIRQAIKEFDIAAEFTPEERAFIRNPSPTKHERVQFSWRYEAYWTLLWSLGFIDQLDRPSKACDAGTAVSMLLDKGRAHFLLKASLRPQSEILDEADLIYRYHWAVVDARINQRKAPAGLHPGVVKERHHALNWLIGYADQEWDDVTTDT